MRCTMHAGRWVGAAMAITGVAIVFAQQAPATFTAAQVAAGRTLYAANCASCHADDLGGRNEAPQLAGSNFLRQWRARSVRELYEYMSAAMPPGGSRLTEADYVALTAFILQTNGG